MTINSFDTVFYTAMFILPGFVINSIIDATNPPQKYNSGKYILKCLGFSLINLALWSWAYMINFEYNKLPNSICFWVWSLIISLLGSTFLGIVVAAIKQKQMAEDILSKLNIKTTHSTPTAWDYYFAKQESGFIIITLIDSTRLYGWYSTNSFTSSDPDDRDIYVEQGYRYEFGKWKIDKQSKGFYVPKDQIKYIEFKKGEE